MGIRLDRDTLRQKVIDSAMWVGGSTAAPESVTLAVYVYDGKNHRR